MPLDDPLQQALSLHQSGQLADAERIYRSILTTNPHHAPALHLLGLIAHQSGHHPSAADLIRRALAIDNTNPTYWNNLGLVLLAQLDPTRAAESFSRAIALNPADPSAHFHLANALTTLGQLDSAVSSYRRALALEPTHAKAHHNLALALENVGDRSAAIDSFRAAVAADPHMVDAHYSLASALTAAGDLDAAIASFRAALALARDRFDIHSDLGTALLLCGKKDESLAEHLTATRLAPDSAEALTNLASAQQQLARSDEAIDTLDHALALRPNLHIARYNLGNTLKSQGRLDEALAAYRRAIADGPHDPVPHDNLIVAMYAHPDFTQRDIHEEELRWRQRFADPLKPHIRPHDNNPNPDRPLRIAYISPDFYEHAHAFYMLPLLAHHDREQFHTTCYSAAIKEDHVTARLKSSASAWRPITGLSDARLADLLRADKIDIAIDISMHLAGHRLLALARKPSPLQLTWLAYTGSTGLDTIDYRFTDPHLDPLPQDSGLGTQDSVRDSFYSERSIRLPETFWCYDPLRLDPPVNPLPALRNNHITFGCLNNFAKVNDITLRLWSPILAALPTARMLILADPGTPRSRTLATFRSLGIPESQIEFIPRQSRADYLAAHHRIDIILDAFPFNGHTTSLDALWMGVPVISLCGDRTVSRGGLSQMTNLKLQDRFVAQTPADFTRLALQAASDLDSLSSLRATLRDRLRASPLMDAPRFTRHFEQALRTLWRAWCSPKGQSNRDS